MTILDYYFHQWLAENYDGKPQTWTAEEHNAILRRYMQPDDQTQRVGDEPV